MTDDCFTGGNTHAWVQAYIPGPGWVDFDPSSGTAGNQNLVRVAVVHEPREAIPLQGTWIGTASDHLAMKVAVKVTAANARAALPAESTIILNTLAARQSWISPVFQGPRCS